MAKFLSENAQAVLNFMQANQGVNLTADSIAEGTGLTSRSVNGTVTGLVKKGFCDRSDEKNEDGKRWIFLTPNGAAVDPAAELAE